MLVTFEQWTRNRAVATLGTNTGAEELPFQNWRHFKEAFAPELVARAISDSAVPVSRCLDPFGGSGTTSLACQFLDVHPITAEVNPYLADLIEAKLTTYNPDKLVCDLGAIARTTHASTAKTKRAFSNTPESFIEPGINGRWLFDRPIADRIAAILYAISALPNKTHRRLFRVILGGILLEVSNVVVNGKGRRYRNNWQSRPRTQIVDELFFEAVRSAIADLHRFSARKTTTFALLRGDARNSLRRVKSCDIAVFSPPYPNSFDYTDVYNVELWMLGYLNSPRDNQKLRLSTISSHVQISRRFAAAPTESKKLANLVSELMDRRRELWDRRLPEMVGAYFADLTSVLDLIHGAMVSGGTVWMVVGDSRYAGVQIECAKILSDIASRRAWDIISLEPFRSMRSSAQQGGCHDLSESLLVLQKPRTNATPKQLHDGIAQKSRTSTNNAARRPARSPSLQHG